MRCEQCASHNSSWASSGGDTPVAQPAILTRCTMRTARRRRKRGCVCKLCCGMRLLGHAHLAVLVGAKHACAAPCSTVLRRRGRLFLQLSAHLLACDLP